MIKKLIMMKIRKYVVRQFCLDMPIAERLQAAKAMSEFIYSGEISQKKGAKD